MHRRSVRPAERRTQIRRWSEGYILERNPRKHRGKEDKGAGHIRRVPHAFNWVRRHSAESYPVFTESATGRNSQIRR